MYNDVGFPLCAKRLLPLNIVLKFQVFCTFSFFVKFNFHFIVTFLLKNLGKAFVPQPKVDVFVMKCVPLEIPRIRLHFDLIEKFCRHYFHYRQKKSIRCVETLFPEEYAKEFSHEVSVLFIIILLGTYTVFCTSQTISKNCKETFCGSLY